MNRDLKNEYPEMTGNFHSCVTETLDNLTAADDNKKIRRFSSVRIAAIAAAAIVLLTVSAFGANELYEKFVEKNNYKVTLVQDENKTEDSAENGTATKNKAEYVRLCFGYMPDYLNTDDAPYKFGIKTDSGEDATSGITFQLFDSDVAKDLEILYVGSVAECMFGENKGAVMRIETGVESDGDSYDKQFLISFDDFGYVLRCYVSERISEEEMMKIANGLYLEECDKSEAFIVDTYIPTADNEGIMEPVDGAYSSYAKEAVVRQLGEEFDIVAYNGDIDGNDYTLTVKNIDVRDNINGLDYSAFRLSEKLSDYIDENGKFKSYERKKYDYGDGENSIATLKENKIVSRKIVLIDIEVKNNEDSSNQFYIDAGVCTVSGKSDVNGVNLFEASYISGQKGGTGGYFKIPFDAGESKTVTYGFIIDADADENDLMFIIGSMWDVVDGIAVR